MLQDVWRVGMIEGKTFGMPKPNTNPNPNRKENATLMVNL